LFKRLFFRNAQNFCQVLCLYFLFMQASAAPVWILSVSISSPR
jgi:hypothetical protein